MHVCVGALRPINGFAHGAGVGGMTPHEFHEITEKFVEDLRLPDGSVRPSRQWMASGAAMGGAHEDREDEADEHRDIDEAMKPGEAARLASSADTMPAVGREEEKGHGSAQGGEPINVYRRRLSPPLDFAAPPLASGSFFGDMILGKPTGGVAAND